MAELVSWTPLLGPWEQARGFLNDRLQRLHDVVSRGQALRATRVSADTTATEQYDVYLVDTSGGSRTITLPAAAVVRGMVWHIKKMTAANTLTVDSSDTIDGAGSVNWTTQYEAQTFASVVVTSPATWGWVRI